MSNDYQAGKEEVMREISRARMNLSGLLQRTDIPDREKLKSALMCMEVILDYLETDSDE